eukprot:1023224-Heterocapsa_arctica.AAC.1
MSRLCLVCFFLFAVPGMPAKRRRLAYESRDPVRCEWEPTGAVRCASRSQVSVDGKRFCKHHGHESRGNTPRRPRFPAEDRQSCQPCPYVSVQSCLQCGKRCQATAASDRARYCKAHARTVDGARAKLPSGASAARK